MPVIFKRSLPVVALMLITLLMAGCGNKQKPTPKPRGYFRIDLPEKSYTPLNIDCPYSFEYPSYSKIVRDPGKVGKPCWINIHFPDFDGNIHISYKPVQGNLKTFTEDARNLAYKHTVKAEAISEQAFVNKEQQVYGIFYDLQGNVASPAQFYLTDSSRHFIRGSLYFRTEPNQDSLDPVIRFVKEDMRHLMETLQWQNR